MSLAIFDLDNTLLNGDSDHGWGQFLIELQLVDADIYRRANDDFYRRYQNGTLDIFEYQAFALQPLRDHNKTELDGWHSQFMATVVESMILPKAEALIDQHRQRGDELMIITATNSFITTPIAARLGIPNLLATDAEFTNGRYTGRVSGTPCFQDGKVTRLQHWLQEHNKTLEGSYFYSDSHNDLPLLQLVDHPVAVDPDPQLSAIAQQRGWSIVSLRN